METYLITARFDRRAGEGQIASRIGIGKPADTFDEGEDLFAKIAARLEKGPVACVFIDEAQFLSKDQVWQLARAVDDLKVPVMCYGLRVDFQGNLFPGSAALLAWADEMREVRAVCHCGKKATMVIRRGARRPRADPGRAGADRWQRDLCQPVPQALARSHRRPLRAGSCLHSAFGSRHTPRPRGRAPIPERLGSAAGSSSHPSPLNFSPPHRLPRARLAARGGLPGRLSRWAGWPMKRGWTRPRQTTRR